MIHSSSQPWSTRRRTRCLPLTLTVAACLCCCSTAAAQRTSQEDFSRQTIVYKQVEGLDIKADVYAYRDDEVRPAIVWIHGGALINGHRAGVSRRIKEFARQQGYVLISIDYRLAPETRLPAIIQDVEDAWRWVQSQGPKKFHVDPDRVAVAGGSAGGYLTLTTGFRADPRPRVLFSSWGYGDLVGPWYSQPSPHPRHNRVKIAEADARKQVSGSPISDSRDRAGNGGLFYVYCRQQGIWPREVSHWNPSTEPEKFYPYMAVKNVTADYPPTVLLHGTADTDVPYEQSVMMAKELQRNEVEHLLLSIDRGEHGLGGGDPQKIEAAYRQAFSFVKRQLESAHR